MKKMWRRLMFVMIAGIAVFAGAAIYADASSLGDRLGDFHWWAFGGALGLALVNYAIRYVRWSLYLKVSDIDVPSRISVLTFVSGFALSVTPGKIGELIKSFLLRETCDVPVSRSAPVVVAERVTDLIALLVLGVVGVAYYGIAKGMVVAGAAVVGAGLLVLAWPAFAHVLINLVARLPKLSSIAHKLRDFYDRLTTLLRPSRLLWSTALATAAWLAECLGFALIISAFPGTDVPWGLATLIYATTTIAGALSFLPGGLLVTEATMTLFLVEAARGVDEPTAVAATILTRLATLWFAVLLGLVTLAIFRRLVPSAENAMESTPTSD